MVAPPLRRDRTPLAPAQPHKWLHTRNSSLGLTSALVKFFLFRVVKQTIAPFMSIEPFDLADPKPISGIDLKETLHDDEQMRRITWICSLKPHVLDALLHGTAYSSKDVRRMWRQHLALLS